MALPPSDGELDALRVDAEPRSAPDARKSSARR